MVVIFSIAGVVSYNSQKYQINSSLSDKLQNEIRHISSDLTDAIRELEHVAHMSVENHWVQQALSNSNDDLELYYLEKQIVEHISQLDVNHGDIVSFTLLDSNATELVYFNTYDPFAMYQPMKVVQAHINNIFSQFDTQNIITVEDTTYMLDMSGDIPEFILVKTFTPEQNPNISTFSKGQSLYTIVIRARVGHYDDFYQDVKSRVSGNVKLAIDSVQASTNISSEQDIEKVSTDNSDLTYQLNSELWNITLCLPEKDLAKLYNPFKLLFVGIVLSVTMLTFLLLRWLIIKQIIKPVEKLTKQVEMAENEGSLYIERSTGSDEVSILTNKYINLISELDDLSKRDSLTGLPNRSRFNLDLARIKEQASKLGNKCAVIYFDLDNFKQVNDKYGHHTGDKLLAVFSERLVESFVDLDWEHISVSEFEFARMSGDEFAIIIGGIDDLDVLSLFTQKVLSLFDNGFFMQGKVYNLGVNIGISVYPDDASTVTEMVNNADAAMYASKKGTTRNRYQFYSKELDDEIKKHAQINESLKESLELGCFYLNYMPIYCSIKGVMKGAEVLLRTNHEKLISYGPADYIPVAESSGLIKDIDYWVIDKALKQLSTWIKQFGYSGTLSINFSSWQLSNVDFVDDLSKLLIKHKIAPERVEMEITETCFAPGDTRSIQMLSALKELGVKIALDDFGTGYTAFSQLINYPVDTLKIDRIFVNAIDTDSKDSQLFDLIVEIARLYDLKVIAEGIETSTQLEYVKSKGGPEVQGFYLSKPINETDFLSAWKSSVNIS